MNLAKLKCCALSTPIQIDLKKPYFSWQIAAQDEYNIRQKAYRITVRKEDGTCCWDSGVKESDETLQVCYEGTQLEPDTRYIWNVTSWIDVLPVVVLSKESWFETGLQGNGWKGQWIGFDELSDGMKEFDPQAPFYCADDFMLGENEYYLPPAPYLRKEFDSCRKPVKAKLYITAQGIVDVKINGLAVTQERLIPGTADYDHVAWAKCYDVTSKICDGKNAIGVILADGWYAGYVGLHNREWYGSKPRMKMQLILTYADGSKETVMTDDTWKASYGAVLEADIFEGECIDASKEPDGYSEAGFDDSSWKTVVMGTEHDVPIEAHPGVPIVAYEAFEAKFVEYRDEDTAIVDLGRLISGVLRITLTGKKGSSIRIRHAEILNEKGELHLDGNRSARAMDTYILSGEGTEVFEPTLTYHGFRYAKICGLKDAVILKIEGIQIGSQLCERTVFETTNPVINQVYDMCLETMLDNVVDNPTDVCARDERLGWGNEGDHTIRGMAVFGNMERFMRKWNEDIWSSQHENGALEPISPPLMMKDIEQFSGDLQTNHGIRIIYSLYKLYGDVQIIRDYYPKMEKFFEYLDHNSDRNIRFATSADWLGIWESTDHSDVNHGYGDCSQGIIGTAHYAYIIRWMEEMSDVIGKHEEAKKYHTLYENVRKAFIQNYVQRDGTIRFGKQGDYVMGLAADLIPQEHVAKAAEHLKKMLWYKGRVFWRGGTPTTPYFLGTLARFGMEKEAIEFLSSRQFPGIAYMADHGPGTIWERWDGIWEDGSIHPQVMNAMSHIGFTTVDQYLVEGLAGITAVEAGYHTMKIEPAVADNLEGLSCVYQSKSGPVSVLWENKENTFRLHAMIPANTKATIVIPCAQGKIPYGIGAKAETYRWADGKVEFCVGSGSYIFTAEKT